jgi:hypothetical protein
VLWKEARAATDDDDVDEESAHHRRMFARAFSVFNERQVDGYVPTPDAPVLPESKRLLHAEAFLANLDINTVFGGAGAYYILHTVHTPPFASFRDAASFIGVWTHELGHASGAKHRLDRDLRGRFGSAAYAAEECPVEILSGLILADLGIAHHPRPDHAYLVLAHGAQGRPARDLHRREQGPSGRRLDARPAASGEGDRCLASSHPAPADLTGARGASTRDADAPPGSDVAGDRSSFANHRSPPRLRRHPTHQPVLPSIRQMSMQGA